MAAIYLIRHGQASMGSEVYDKLSDTGITQAKIMAGALALKVPKPDIILAGTMVRHQETAEHCLAQFQAPNLYQQVISDSGWNEYDHQAILGAYRPEFATSAGIRTYLVQHNLSPADFKIHYIAAINRWISQQYDDQYPETWLQFKQRVLNQFFNLAEQHPHKNSFVYTSGGPISLMVCNVLNIPIEQMMTINWSLVNAGITKIVIAKDRSLSLSTLNEHHYFEPIEQRALLTYT